MSTELGQAGFTSRPGQTVNGGQTAPNQPGAPVKFVTTTPPDRPPSQFPKPGGGAQGKSGQGGAGRAVGGGMSDAPDNPAIYAGQPGRGAAQGKSGVGRDPKKVEIEGLSQGRSAAPSQQAPPSNPRSAALASIQG